MEKSERIVIAKRKSLTLASARRSSYYHECLSAPGPRVVIGAVFF